MKKGIIRNDSGLSMDEAMATVKGGAELRIGPFSIIIEKEAIDEAHLIWNSMVSDSSCDHIALREKVAKEQQKLVDKLDRAFKQHRMLARSSMDRVMSNAVFLHVSQN